MDVQALLRPVCDSAPAGADSRYEPEYLGMLEEVDKLSSLSRSQECRWEVVAEQAALILQHKAKDFLAAAYLACALSRLHGLEGMADGAALLAGMLTSFWETGFPALRRVRGRINAISWWQERTEAFLDSLSSDPDGRFAPELLARADQAMSDLDSAIADHLPDLPSLRPLRDKVRRLPRREGAPPAPDTGTLPPADQSVQAEDAPQASDAPKAGDAEAASKGADAAAALAQPRAEPVAGAARPAADLAAASAPEQDMQPASEPLSDQAPRPAGSEDVRTLGRDMLRAAADFAEAALALDPLSPLAWQALCLARLGRIEAMPPAEDGRTLLPPPEQSERAALEQLVTAGMHTEALTALRNSWGTHLFWLDSLRMLAQSLQALHSPAADVLALETLAFVRRLPGVELAAFSDGSPFADADTRAWLNAICAESASSLPPDAAASLTARARTLFAQNRQAEALDLLDTGLAAADSHTWLVLRCEQVHLLVRSEAYVPALALAEDLLDRADALHTESWDRELLLDILRVTDSCLAKASAAQPDEAGHAARRDEIRQRIALLRPAAALHGL